jgi:hypothetical protein
MSTVAIGLETLIEKRTTLYNEQMAAYNQYEAQIKELDSCIEILSGRKYKELIEEDRYDDENPHYIKGTEDGI